MGTGVSVMGIMTARDAVGVAEAGSVGWQAARTEEQERRMERRYLCMGKPYRDPHLIPFMCLFFVLMFFPCLPDPVVGILNRLRQDARLAEDGHEI